MLIKKKVEAAAVAVGFADLTGEHSAPEAEARVGDAAEVQEFKADCRAA